MLAERARYLYPVPRLKEGLVQTPGVVFDFASDCLPFRKQAAFLFRYLTVDDGSASEPGGDSQCRVPSFELNWLDAPEGLENFDGVAEGEYGEGVALVPEGEHPREVVMRVDGRDYFRTPHLGSAVANFESFFSSEMASLAAEASGYLHIHGAAVETSSGTILIVEEQERGKTSLSMALMALGARPVSDDSLLLVPGEKSVMRVPRNFRYHPGTHSALAPIGQVRPDYSFFTKDEPGAPVYYYFDAYREQGFEAGCAKPVSLVVVPNFSKNKRETKLTPLRWGEMLRTLISQTMTPIDDDSYTQGFGALGNVACCRIEWGDLDRAARLVLEYTG